MNHISFHAIQEPYQCLLVERQVPERSQAFFLRWAMTWLAKTGQTPVEPDTRRFFEDLGRRPGLQDWQFVQAVRAVAWMARDILKLPWAEAFDWRGLADQAKQLENDHRTLGRDRFPGTTKRTRAGAENEGKRHRHDGDPSGDHPAPRTGTGASGNGIC